MGLRWSPHVSTAPSSLDTRAQACSAHTLISFLSTRLRWGGHCTPLSNQPSEPPGRKQRRRRCCRLSAKGCREKEAIPKVQGHRQASDGRRVGGDAAGARETQ